jgi:hypothetical protein
MRHPILHSWRPHLEKISDVVYEVQGHCASGEEKVSNKYQERSN